MNAFLWAMCSSRWSSSDSLRSPVKNMSFAFPYSLASLQGSQVVLTKKVMVTAGKLKWPHMCRSWGDAAHWQERCLALKNWQTILNQPDPRQNWDPSPCHWVKLKEISHRGSDRKYTFSHDPKLIQSKRWTAVTWERAGIMLYLRPSPVTGHDNRGGTEMLKNITTKILEHRSGQKLKFRENLTPPRALKGIPTKSRLQLEWG